ncbi:hypothetical protein P9112_008110 [Eukaryota sp. TZLM1-RC]
MPNHTAQLINGFCQDLNGITPAKESNPSFGKSYPPHESNPSFGKSYPPQESELPAEKSLASQKGNHLPKNESELPAEQSHTSQKGSNIPNEESGYHVVDVTEPYTYPNNSSELFPCRKSFLTPSEQRRFKAFAISNNSNACTEGEGGEGERQSTTSSLKLPPHLLLTPARVRNHKMIPEELIIRTTAEEGMRVMMNLLIHPIFLIQLQLFHLREGLLKVFTEGN